jgi:DNA helicase IV
MPFQFHVPPINALSVNQQQATSFVLHVGECLIITGCPGSGKTTVANFRASQLETEGKAFKYIIYAKVLEAYVRESFSHPSLSIDRSKVATFASWFFKKYRQFVFEDYRNIRQEILISCFERTGLIFDEMIYDEAQDLDVRILSNTPLIARSITICADDAQNVFDANELNSVERIRGEMASKNVGINNIHLTINYRNSPEVYAFARALIPNNPAGLIERFIKEPGQKPTVIYCNSTQEMLGTIRNIIINRMNENIGILCDTQSQVRTISAFLKRNNIENTQYFSGMVSSEAKLQLANLKNIVVCTNKSAKGLEFQTVLIPFAEKMRTDEQNRRCYYVACTRAQTNLFLLTSETSNNMPLLSQIQQSLYETIQ